MIFTQAVMTMVLIGHASAIWAVPSVAVWAGAWDR